MPNFSWAIAGRSRASLERIVASIRMTTPADAKLLPSIVVADVSDEHSLKVMAESTKCEKKPLQSEEDDETDETLTSQWCSTASGRIIALASP